MLENKKTSLTEFRPFMSDAGLLMIYLAYARYNDSLWLLLVLPAISPTEQGDEHTNDESRLPF